MTKYNLVLDINNCVAPCNVHELDDCFDQFEESDITGITELGAILDKVATNMAKIPNELRSHFQTIQGFQNINEIMLENLPPRYAYHGIEMVQLMASLFEIVNQLLDTDLIPCVIHEAHSKIDHLFHALQRLIEEVTGVETVDFENSSLNHFFPNLADDMTKITLFPL